LRNALTDARSACSSDRLVVSHELTLGDNATINGHIVFADPVRISTTAFLYNATMTHLTVTNLTTLAGTIDIWRLKPF
jgi:hypothetical protein